MSYIDEEMLYEQTTVMRAVAGQRSGFVHGDVLQDLVMQGSAVTFAQVDRRVIKTPSDLDSTTANNIVRQIGGLAVIAADLST